MKLFSRYFLVMLLLSGCATVGQSLKMTRQPVGAPQDLPGLYTLVLIGDGTGNDARRMAILDPEGDAYSFRPVTPEYWVKRLSGLTAPAALAAAEKFLAGHCAYNGYWLKGLLLSNGVAVGHEMIPDYPSAKCESGDVVIVGYRVGDDSVIKVYVSLIWDGGLDLFRN
jgi:hypothetical protein